MQVVDTPITSLSPDPSNVRRHSEAQLEKLMACLRRFGQTLPLLIDAANVVRVGNARLEAMKRLGWQTVKTVTLNLSPTEWVALAVADNKLHDDSEFDSDALAQVLKALGQEGFDMGTVGFTVTEVAKLIGESNGEGVPNDPDVQWQGMPECVSDDQTAAFSVKVNFANAEDREAFAKLVGQTVTENTRSIWYPPAPIGTYADKRYV